MSESAEAREPEKKATKKSGVLAGLDPMGTPRTPVWRVRWFQVMLGGLVVLAVASYVLPPVFEVVYMTRPVLLPVLIGLGLAYAVNPLVTWANRRHRMPRLFSAAALLLWFFGLVALSFAWLTGPVIGQAQGLLRDIPAYVEATTEAVGDYLEIPESAKEIIEGAAHGDIDQAVAAVLPEPDAAEPGDDAAADAEAGGQGGEATLEVRVNGEAGDASEAPTTLLEAGPDGGLVVVDAELDADVDAAIAGPDGESPGLFSRLFERLQTMELSTLSSTGLAVLDVGASTVIGVLGLAGYVTVASLVVCFCFFFAVWKWPSFVAWWMPYLPASHCEEIIAVAARMDRSVSAFLRGRLIQATLLAVVLSVGFTLAGTPGGLILGIAGGILGLVPYAGAIVWPIAVGLSVMSGIAVEDSGLSLGWAVLGPTLAYGVGQGLDAWVIEPLVQGKATNLDALTVLLVVLAGGAVAGLLGLLLAIPFAACVKILWQEVIGPRIRAVARAS